jgi:hypothetical protein
MTMKTLTALALAATLAGCASSSGIVPIGPDTFMSSKQAATGFPGLGSQKAELLAEANGYCAKAGKVMMVTHTAETQPPYVMGNFPRSEITFMCLDKGDPQLKRPRLEKEASTVVEVR